jgi:DNA-binding response OmpR family regulator
VTATPSPLAGTILVVDDVKENVEVLERRLLQRGFEVETATTGRRALEVFAKKPIDLVLLDVMMPEMSGLEVIKFIRQRANAALLPVIVISARDDHAAMIHLFAAGANDYIVKPYDFGIALARIAAHLRVARAHRAALSRAPGGSV